MTQSTVYTSINQVHLRRWSRKAKRAGRVKNLCQRAMVTEAATEDMQPECMPQEVHLNHSTLCRCMHTYCCHAAAHGIPKAPLHALAAVGPEGLAAAAKNTC